MQSIIVQQGSKILVNQIYKGNLENFWAEEDFEYLALQYIPGFSFHTKEMKKNLLKENYLEHGEGENMLRIFLTDNVEFEYFQEEEITDP